MIRVLIAENIPSLNKGEMTIMEGLIESFSIIDNVQISMFSQSPITDQSRYASKVNIIDITKSWILTYEQVDKFIIKFIVSGVILLQHITFLIAVWLFNKSALKIFTGEIWNEYLTTDLMIIGHDSNYCLGGEDSETPFLYFQYLPFFCKILGKRIVFYSGTFYPITTLSCFFTLLIRYSLEKIDLITLREEKSFLNLKQIGLRKENFFLTADLAFLLKPQSIEQVEKIMVKEKICKTNRILIGFTVARKKANSCFPNLKSYDLSYHLHNGQIADVIDTIIDELNAEIVFFPHSIEMNDDDRLVAKDIYSLCKNKKYIKIIENEYGPAELKGLMGKLDLFIGERLHSTINAMSMGIPSIILGLSSDQRLGIITLLGQENQIFYIDNFKKKLLISKIHETWQNCDKIKIDLEKQNTEIRKKAMLNGVYLKKVLKS